MGPTPKRIKQSIPLSHIPLYHTTPKRIKKRCNTGMIPVNVPHCLGVRVACSRPLGLLERSSNRTNASQSSNQLPQTESSLFYTDFTCQQLFTQAAQCGRRYFYCVEYADDVLAFVYAWDTLPPVLGFCIAGYTSGSACERRSLSAAAAALAAANLLHFLPPFCTSLLPYLHLADKPHLDGILGPLYSARLALRSSPAGTSLSKLDVCTGTHS